MTTPAWQKSSYCQEGEACVHISAGPDAVLLTESGDPAQVVLSTSGAAFAALLDAVSARSPGR
ncbi:DUF397 domain-containing protein [Streptomyces sp. NPDC058291]|jgi:hypothetical protein|uniref:DUF397 domain-containing protein n=1 Tax=Streptomyces sp. NPDC058291 TaxID=3346427 RepID=UPI0036E3C107